MIYLYVYDFDKTLISFDSFREYVFYWLRYMPVKMSKLLMFRILRIYTVERFKQKVIKLVSAHSDFEELNQKFVKRILPHVNQDMLSKGPIIESTSKQVLILSASPDIYISRVVNALGVSGKGSYLVNGSLFHLYGSGKVKFLSVDYPKSTYRYMYAISDSKSDQELLELFESYELI